MRHYFVEQEPPYRAFTSLEAARRVRSQRHVGTHVQLVRRATGLADQGGQLHRVAGRMRGRDQFLGAGRATGVIGRALGEGHLVGGKSRAGQLDLAGALLQGAIPGGTSGTGGHISSC